MTSEGGALIASRTCKLVAKGFGRTCVGFLLRLLLDPKLREEHSSSVDPQSSYRPLAALIVVFDP